MLHLESKFRELLRPEHALNQLHLDIHPGQRNHVFAIGKPASLQLEAFLNHFSDFEFETKLAIAKDGMGVEKTDFEQVLSDHPVISRRSLAAAELLTNKLKTIGEDDHVIFLVSGGASALIEMPVEGASFEELQAKHRELLNSGKSIIEMNRQRMQLSQIKNGGLLQFCKAKKISTIVSIDIPNEDPAFVSSGPTLYTQIDERNPSELKKKQACEGRDHQTHILFSPSKFLGQATQIMGAEAQNLGVLDMKESEGIEFHLDHCKASGIYLSGGEITIEVPESSGRGGRNSHLAASLALRFIEQNRRFQLYFLASDGDDGSGGISSVFLDSEQLETQDVVLLRKCHQNFDTFSFFESKNWILKGGPTANNLMDLRIICLF